MVVNLGGTLLIHCATRNLCESETAPFKWVLVASRGVSTDNSCPLLQSPNVTVPVYLKTTQRRWNPYSLFWRALGYGCIHLLHAFSWGGVADRCPVLATMNGLEFLWSWTPRCERIQHKVRKCRSSEVLALQLKECHMWWSGKEDHTENLLTAFEAYTGSC